MTAHRKSTHQIEKELAEALGSHSDALVHGRDDTPNLLARHASEAPVLTGLFRLSHRLYDTLLPVEPSREFVADLKDRLTQSQAQTTAAWLERKHRVARFSSTLGLLLMSFAVLTLFIRLIASLIMIIGVILSRGRRGAPASR